MPRRRSKSARTLALGGVLATLLAAASSSPASPRQAPLPPRPAPRTAGRRPRPVLLRRARRLARPRACSRPRRRCARRRAGPEHRDQRRVRRRPVRALPAGVRPGAHAGEARLPRRDQRVDADRAGSPCRYPQGSQLAAALAFISAHRSRGQADHDRHRRERHRRLRDLDQDQPAARPRGSAPSRMTCR